MTTKQEVHDTLLDCKSLVVTFHIAVLTSTQINLGRMDLRKHTHGRVKLAGDELDFQVTSSTLVS